MAKGVSVKKKIEVACEAILGQKIAPLAREAGVQRRIVYEWKDKAEKALKQALQPQKRGVKPKINKEQEMIKKTQKKIEYLSEELAKFGGYENRPKRCPFCGSEKVYRNGRIPSGIKRGAELLEIVKEKVVLVPRYNCWVCGKRVYPEKQIFFWKMVPDMVKG